MLLLRNTDVILVVVNAPPQALVVTDYLLRNGDERFVQKMKNHQRAITRLQDRRSVRGLWISLCFKAGGLYVLTVGHSCVAVKSICDLADKIWKLLSDEKYLKEQRETAARMRPKLAVRIAHSLFVLS